MNITLDEVSEYLEQFHKYSGYGMCLCPFHEDNNPSCLVTDKGYKCKSCGARGSLEKLYSEVSGRIVVKEKTYNQSAFIWRNWEEKFGSIQNIAKIAHKSLINNPNDGEYLFSRKLGDYIKAGMMGYLDGYYTFPIKDEYDEIQGIVARASPTIQTKNVRYSVSKNCGLKLYVPSWRKALKNDYLFVCYGTLDTWTLYGCGYAGVTGISGQELSAENLNRFRKPMYIIPDKGEEKSAIELQSCLGWRGMTLYLDFPEGCKDLQDIHMKFGLDTVSRLIEKAKEKYVYE
jgi:DNA primase